MSFEMSESKTMARGISTAQLAPCTRCIRKYSFFTHALSIITTILTIIFLLYMPRQ